MDSYDVLVIFLSCALGVSLIVWIVAGLMIIKVLQKLKLASENARQAAENVEEFTSQLKNAGKATAVGTVVHQITNLFRGRK